MVSGIDIGELPLIGDVISTDIIGISEPDIYVRGQYQNKKLSSFIMIDDLTEGVGYLIEERFGTMISASSADYSVYNHKHDDLYNKQNGVKTFYKQSDQTTVLGDIFLNGKIISVYIPISSYSDYTEKIDYTVVPPSIGELKFVYKSKMYGIDIKSSDFDGWVYADGQTYKLDYFVEKNKISEKLGDNGDGTFTVPSLSDFLMPNNGTNEEYKGTNSLKRIEHVTYTDMHIHDIDLTVRGDMDFQCNINVGNSIGHGKYVMNGQGGTSENQVYSNQNINVQFKPAIESKGVNTNNFGENDETYPTHHLLPVCIYLGKSQWSN